MFKPVPESQCCGCMACVNACPQDIIEIKSDILGFSYPVITQENKCIGCNKCNVSCPKKAIREYTTNVGEVICACNKNDVERIASSSGGIFPLLCRTILHGGGVCYGVSFTESFGTKHIRITKEAELSKIVSSKYSEASRGYVYREVKEDLLKGRKVLFSGTPCQIAGLKKYLDKDWDNLLLVDLFCYGIPSPVIWKKWLDYISNGRKPTFVDFRDKTYGWDNYSLRIEFSDGSIYCKPKKNDLFIATFSKGSYIRPSCHTCNLKAFPRFSDITLGDFQELEDIFPDKDPHNGWSMVRINSQKGRDIFGFITDFLDYTVISSETMDRVHPGIGAPSPEHPHHQKIVDLAQKLPINKLLKKYATLTYKMRINQRKTQVKHKIKYMLQKMGFSI